jgi:probable rRNA maturation factor
MKHDHPPKGYPVTIDLELQIATSIQTLPHPAQIREWVNVALWKRVDTAELTIRIVDEEESTQLNEQYRHKVGPTNVLSFPYVEQPGIISRYIGDIIICAPLVETEAKTHNKPLLAYWAHMVTHGILHLLGYDHITDEESTDMQGVETAILHQLGFPPPYGDIIES